MLKKITSLILLFPMIFCFGIIGFASDKKQETNLKFNNDGKFTIVHLTDFHVHYPVDALLKQYVSEMLDDVKPDIVILGGDIVTDAGEPNEFSATPIEDAINEVCSLFTEKDIYFTITFGNHDRQFGKNGEELLSLYTRYGGKYFLGYDAEPELYGEGTHNLPVMSSDGSKVKFNLFMIDSGDSVYDENGKRLGYDSVHPDQIEWYKTVAEKLKSDNGGKTVPSMVFQHIIVQEIDDMLFYNVKNSAGKLGEDFDGRHYLFTPIPKIHNIKDGVIMEKPCPGYYNFGQLEAMKQTEDVIAVFSGHDHSNTFTVNIDGIDIVNTGGCKYQAPLRLFTSGVRVITVDENNPYEYKSSMYTVKDAIKKDGSKIFEKGGISKFDLLLTTFWEKLTSAVMSFFWGK